MTRHFLQGHPAHSVRGFFNDGQSIKLLECDMENTISEKKVFDLAEELWSKMEQGLAPWQCTWNAGEAPGRALNVISSRLYRGGNAFWLMTIAAANGWGNEWVTFKECAKAGGSLKGAKSTRIEVPRIKKVVDTKTGEEKERLIGFSSGYIFNVAQVEGATFAGGKGYKLDESLMMVDQMLEEMKARGVTYIEGSEDEGCWYNANTDKIGMPQRTVFVDPYEFSAALIHQLSRSTMQAGRVERDPVSFAYEVVRSEMASTLLCSTLNLPRSKKHVENCASYMRIWLEEFADSKGMLLKAASEATAIHDYLMDTVAPKAQDLKAA
jgi:antirestriction protein ArdC